MTWASDSSTPSFILPPPINAFQNPRARQTRLKLTTLYFIFYSFASSCKLGEALTPHPEETLSEPIFKTKQELVHEKLRTMVLRGVLRPGEVLVASDIANWFGVSSVPAREAIQRLKNEGLVENAPHARAVVKGMSKEDALEIAEMRLLLEPAAAYSAAFNMPIERIEQLEVLLMQMDQYVDDQANEEYARANEEFHLAIYDRCTNMRLTQTIVECWELSQRFAVLAGFPRQIGKGQGEHHLICAALKGGDAEKVRELTREHRARVLESMKQWEDSASSQTL